MLLGPVHVYTACNTSTDQPRVNFDCPHLKFALPPGVVDQGRPFSNTEPPEQASREALSPPELPDTATRQATTSPEPVPVLWWAAPGALATLADLFMFAANS